MGSGSLTGGITRVSEGFKAAKPMRGCVTGTYRNSAVPTESADREVASPSTVTLSASSSAPRREPTLVSNNNKFKLCGFLSHSSAHCCTSATTNYLKLQRTATECFQCKFHYSYQLWVNCPLWVSQLGQLSLPSLCGRHMSSNPCNYMHYGGRDHCTTDWGFIELHGRRVHSPRVRAWAVA